MERWNPTKPKLMEHIPGVHQETLGSGNREAPSDKIAVLQTTLDEGGNFSSKVISDAYDGFQAAFPNNTDKLLHAWAQVNIMDSDKSGPESR